MTSTQTASGLGDQVRQFFHEEEVPCGLALVRILMPLVVLVTVLERWTWTRELYSSDGVTTSLWNNYGLSPLLPELAGGVAVALHTALIFFLVSSALGWQTRLSLVLSTVLYTYFTMMDAVGTITKYTVIASHVLLILSFSRCGAVWSIDSWLRNRRQPVPLEPPRSPAWPRRLLQLLIGFVYFGAGITKINTPTFFTGDQLVSWMMTNVNFDHRLGEYLSMHPALLVVCAYITVVWELLFLFTAWQGWRRTAMLTLGLGFHVMTMFTLGLYIFPPICCAIYLAFFNEQEYRRFGTALRQKLHESGWRWERLRPAGRALPVRLPQALRMSAGSLFVLLATTTVMGGLALEHQLDLYGRRRPDGPHTLRELDPEYVRLLLARPERIRDVDTFFSLDVGTVLLGGVLLNCRHEFRPGETLIAQCNISPPHEDMWVECNLHDNWDRVLDTSAQIVSREMLRANFTYTLTAALEPGDYHLVLKKAGKEITRRKIVLHPPKGTPPPAPGP